jgi:apolipoprotein N-acyltransferase
VQLILTLVVILFALCVIVLFMAVSWFIFTSMVTFSISILYWLILAGFSLAILIWIIEKVRKLFGMSELFPDDPDDQESK